MGKPQPKVEVSAKTPAKESGDKKTAKPVQLVAVPMRNGSDKVKFTGAGKAGRVFVMKMNGDNEELIRVVKDGADYQALMADPKCARTRRELKGDKTMFLASLVKVAHEQTPTVLAAAQNAWKTVQKMINAGELKRQRVKVEPTIIKLTLD